MTSLEKHLKAAREKRWANATDEQKQETARVASRAYWDSMTPEQRSAEVKRRWEKRKQNKPKPGPEL